MLREIFKIMEVCSSCFKIVPKISSVPKIPSPVFFMLFHCLKYALWAVVYTWKLLDHTYAALAVVDESG